MVEIQFYGGESIAFIGCHLAAHEEKKFYTRRIETIRSILGCAWRDRIEKAFGCEGNGARVGNIRLKQSLRLLV